MASRVAANVLGLLLGVALTFAAVSLLRSLYEYYAPTLVLPVLLGAVAAVVALRRSCSWLTVWVVTACGVLLGCGLYYVAAVALFVLSSLSAWP